MTFEELHNLILQVSKNPELTMEEYDLLVDWYDENGGNPAEGETPSDYAKKVWKWIWDQIL
jgi:hypothetical protein